MWTEGLWYEDCLQLAPLCYGNRSLYLTCRGLLRDSHLCHRPYFAALSPQAQLLAAPPENVKAVLGKAMIVTSEQA